MSAVDAVTLIGAPVVIAALATRYGPRRAARDLVDFFLAILGRRSRR